ncbi:hypothetical protein [Sorangium sp. So ce1097]|uniref:hypothetical protein n=1 Tax=Sorangium sp. So ce1097 TaxID=3133330 RepID=UPI003F6417B2
MTTRTAVPCLLAAWVAGCQVLAPLPGVGGEGAGPTGSDGGELGGGELDGGGGDGGGGDGGEDDGGEGDGGEGEVSQGSEVTPPPASTGPCGNAACSTHCARSMDACERTPQYPSVETCCAACEAMPSPEEYTACRAVESGDPAGCTGSGLLGPMGRDGCTGRCEAICTLYTALCPDTPAMTSLEGCMLLCLTAEKPAVFNACTHLRNEGSFECRLQLIYSALDETDGEKRTRICRDIVQGRCMKPKCEVDDDD